MKGTICWNFHKLRLQEMMWNINEGSTEEEKKEESEEEEEEKKEEGNEGLWIENVRQRMAGIVLVEKVKKRKPATMPQLTWANLTWEV